MEDNPRAGGTFNFIQMESVEHLTSTPSAQSNVPDLSDEKKQIIPFASPLQFVATPLEKTDSSLAFNASSSEVKPTEQKTLQSKLMKWPHFK
ncbi:hypothetical protein ZEAMMB73_Zm00001d050690 [Zea mays]|jgi:hypothetical protein|uniref:Uncharacterized protein n=1 Tax=Zea mays TaxID=4577 RepID=A0A1D6Q2W5_MAIZE|nr:hypothetical protein ZEAMMB73_Zm00001d050690 [Zea mays]